MCTTPVPTVSPKLKCLRGNPGPNSAPANNRRDEKRRTDTNTLIVKASEIQAVQRFTLLHTFKDILHVRLRRGVALLHLLPGRGAAASLPGDG